MPPLRTPGVPEISASRPRSRVRPFGRSKPESRTRAAQDATPEPDKGSNKTSAFMQLPLEMKLLIVEFLPARDIPNIRLISESWGAAGAPSIFRTGFTIRPHLDDMDRLRQVVTKKEIAKGIRHIELFAGDMEKSQLERAIEREKQQLLRATGGHLIKVWRIVDAIFEETRFKKHCRKEVLKSYFEQLPNLEAVKVTSQQCPVRGLDMPFCMVWRSMEENFDEEDPYDDEEDVSHFLDFRTSITRHSAIMYSVLACKSIQRLDLDSFPIDYFGPFISSESTIDDFLTKLNSKDLAHITELSISIIGCGFRRDYTADVGRKMAKFLCCFQNLRSLDLSYEEADDDTDECLMGFEDTFYRLRFPHLHSLRISGCDSNEEDLGNFLFAHKPTLRNLHIGEAGCTPVEKTWKDVLTDLRDHMALEKFELYVPETEGRIYDSNWKPVVGDGKGKIKDAKLLELYVQGRCPWPMAESDPRGEGGWKRKFGAEDMMLLHLGEEELRDLLGEEWETDGSGESDDDSMADVDEDDSDETDEYFSVDEEFLGFPDEVASGEGSGNADPEDGEWEDMDVDADEETTA